MLGAALDPDVDEVARKEYMRKNRRRDIGEIVNELGEGRGKLSSLKEWLSGRMELIDMMCRYRRPRLCRAESGTSEGGLWH